MKNLLKFIGIVSLTCTINAQEVYTVDQLIVKSLENSPDIQISRLEYDASKQRYETAFSNYLPKIDAIGSAGYLSQDSVATPPTPEVDDSYLAGKLTLKQLIYDFGKTGGTTDVQKFASESYFMKNMQKISDKKRDVKNSYYTVLKAKALIDVQKENVKLNQAQLYRSKKYFEAGIRTKIDISDAEVRLIKAKLELRKAQYNLKLAYADLDKVIGVVRLESSYDVYSEKLNLDTIYDSLSAYDLTLKDSILYAYENRYEVKQVLASIKAKQSDITSVTGEYYPSAYFDANYNYQSFNDPQISIPENKWNASVNLSWNLYQGGSTNAKKQEKIINANISSSQLLETKLYIKKSTTSAYINVNKTKDTVELDQGLVQVSIEKFDQASKRYEHGLSDYIELQEARQGYIDSKATLIVDYYNYYIAVTNLNNAIGR